MAYPGVAAFIDKVVDGIELCTDIQQRVHSCAVVIELLSNALPLYLFQIKS